MIETNEGAGALSITRPLSRTEPARSWNAHRSRLSNMPNAVAMLFLFDLVCLTAAYLLVLVPIHTRLDIMDGGQLPLITLLATATSLLLLYAAGSYRRDALVRFSTAMIPFGWALACSAALLIPLMHYGLGTLFPDQLLYRSISRCATLALLGSGIGLAAGMADRLLFFAMSRRNWFQRKILVIGTGERARYIFELFSEEKYRGFAALTFVPESVLGIEAQTSLVPASSTIPAGDRSVYELASEMRVDSV